MSVQTIKAWSYSRLDTWRRCPFLAKLKFIVKLKEVVNKAMQRGSDIHTLCEKYIKGELPRIPKELRGFHNGFRDFRRKFRSGYVQVEHQWAFTRDWDICEWFDRKTYCRMVVDAVEEIPKGAIMRVVDFKTGRVYEDKNREQMKLYALGAMMRYPDAKKIRVELWYLDHDIVLDEDFEVSEEQVEILKSYFDAEAAPMLKDKKFPATPNYLCKWCHFRKENGGPCKY